MTMDPTTESIAHFIGLFALKTEELRLRQDYLEFRLKKTEQETSTLEPVGVDIEAPHELLPYVPALAYAVTMPDSVGGLPKLPPIDALVELPQLLAPDPIFPPGLIEDGIRLTASVASSFSLTPPGSLVSVTLQKITLNDDDLFLNGLGVDFVDPELLLATLDAIVAQAEALSGFQMPDLPGDGDWITFAQDMLAAMDLGEAPDGQAQVAVIRGNDATGVFVDGVAVVEAPVWTDLLPLYLRPEPPADDEGQQIPDDGEATDGQTVQKLSESPGEGRFEVLDGHDFGRDFDGHQVPEDLPAGHQVVSGANTAINEIAVYSKWLDASVYVVLGDVARLDAISQVNVLVEHDTIDGVSQTQPSVAKNVAAISTVSSEDPTTEAPGSGAPAATFVARIEADLIQVNWVKQFTFVTDFDRAEVVFSGSTTFLGLGENQMVNSAVLNEFGYNFDLVFVAGDMVDATIVSQKNILFDSDDVTTTAPATASSATADQSENSQHQPEAEGDIPVPAATMASAGIEDTALPPAEIAHDAAPPGPAATVEPAQVDAAPEARTVPEPDQGAEAQPALSLADNLLLNEVTIARTGADSLVEMKQAFQDAAEALRDGAETLAGEIAEDVMFAGTEALRVLQIDGDLARINLFEQTNIVGDADQIRLEMARLRDELGAEAELIAGSNALVNRVSILEDGIDSQIMAAQNVYSDALIHQAGLFDADSVPTGVTMSNLTNDAVAAFIAQDAMGATEPTDHIAPTGNYETGSTDDVMQAMLA